MNYRRKLTRIVTFLGGIYFFVEFLLPPEIGGIKFASFHEDISNGLITVAQMSLGLGLINILMVHGSKILLVRKGLINSIALLFGLGLMFTVTYLDWRQGQQAAVDAARYFTLRDFSQKIESDWRDKKEGVLPPGARNLKLQEALTPLLNLGDDKIPSSLSEIDSGLAVAVQREIADRIGKAKGSSTSLFVGSGDPPTLQTNLDLANLLSEIGLQRIELLSITQKGSLTKKLYNFLYNGLFISLGAAMFSLLGFYIASAAYRAFRIKSAESALMMLAAFVVMLGQIPFGLWIWDGFPEVRLWLLSVPSAAAFRAIKIGAAVAGLIMAYRMWFSIESEEFTQR